MVEELPVAKCCLATSR